MFTNPSKSKHLPNALSTKWKTVQWLMSLLLACFQTGLGQAAFAQSVQYRSGLIQYTPVNDVVIGGTPGSNGTGYFVSQAYISSPPQPQVNQVYYVVVSAAGIIAPAVGRLVEPYFQLPNGTNIVSNASIPVRCYYRAMDGTGNYIEFTNTVITDQSFGANLRVTGCPQPSASPLPVFTTPYVDAVLIERRDPQTTNQTWPMGSYAAYEFHIPVTSNRTMDGFSVGDRMYAPVRSTQSDGQWWANPNLSLLVNPASADPVADIRVEQQLPPPPPPPNGASYSIRCTNGGPNSALNATCGFNNIPSGVNANVLCNPSATVASLASGASITCSIITNQFIGFHYMSGIASSQSIDNNLGNNQFYFYLNGRITDYIFGGPIGGGFEVCPAGQVC